VAGSSSGTGAVPVPLGAADRRKLAAVPADGEGHAIDLSSLDDYRVPTTACRQPRARRFGRTGMSQKGNSLLCPRRTAA
jgi:hypothetical protein